MQNWLNWWKRPVRLTPRKYAPLTPLTNTSADADAELEKLAHVEMDTHHRPKCTSAAHATTLETVELWATSPLPDGDSKIIYWLRGSKSAAAVITSL
jgi:hypothetical protein